MQITLPAKPKVVQQEGNSAVFEIENLYPGYGITLGNALRRVLLSSLPGAAVTTMKFSGVEHEFSTIPGVAEDVVQIMLNVKQLRFRFHGEEPQVIRVHAKKEKEVRGMDLQVPTQVEVVTKDVLIATLTDRKAELDMELTVEPGLGYLPVEARKGDKLSIGTIAVDAIFTPMRKVNFSVENMRVGERIDFNRLRLHVETDGTLTPQEAFQKATQILMDQFSNLKLPEEAVKGQRQDVLKSSLDDLAVSTRTKSILAQAGMKNIGGVLRKSKKDLGALEGLGPKGLGEIEDALGKLGLSPKE